MRNDASLFALGVCCLIAVTGPAFANRSYDAEQAFALREGLGGAWEFHVSRGSDQVHAIARANLVSDTLDSAVIRVSCQLRRDLTSEPGIEIYFWEKGYAFLAQRLTRNILGGGWTDPSSPGQSFGQIAFVIGESSYSPLIIARPQSGEEEEMEQYNSSVRETLSFLTQSGALHVSFDWYGAQTIPLDFEFSSEGKDAALAELSRHCPFPRNGMAEPEPPR
ncbi:hypothetical protein [Pararhodobacter sp.]|uniref:hypothetical protein n=1 Tax=Pararhodobacter sp. TaxID=2127056 RepID=UPI002FDC90C4